MATASTVRRDAGRARAAWAFSIAVLGHAGLAALALGQPHVAPVAMVAVTEIDLAPPPKAPEPEPPPVEEPKAPELKAPAAAPRRARAPSRPAPAPPTAKAAEVRAVDEAVKTADEPVRFVTDPNGTSFGYGAVQRGGTAESAKAGATAQAEPGPARSGSGSETPELSRPPRLGESDPCRGFFPSRARVDRGEVTLKVRVERDGAVRSVSVSAESPAGHGFGFAARDCLLSKHFSPALDKQGRAVAVVTPVTVRFSR